MKTQTVKTNSKAFNLKAYAYLLAAIDATESEYPNTETGNLQHVADRFMNEYLFSQNLRRYGSTQNVLREWFMGLPSCINVDFENYRIIEIAKEWGSLEQDADDRKEDRVIENWFNLMAFKLIQLWDKHGIKVTPKG